MHKPAKEPKDLEKLFVERANAGDVEGLVALYEPNAIVAYGEGVAIGRTQIREFFVEFLGNRPQLDLGVQAATVQWRSCTHFDPPEEWGHHRGSRQTPAGW